MATIAPTTSIFDPRHLATVFSFLALLMLTVFALTSSCRRAKTVLLALALMIFPFLPASNLFFPVGFVVAERVLYLPSMGFCMLVGLGASLLLHKHSNVLLLLFMSLCLGTHSFKTLVRNQDWQNDNSLFRSAVRINGANGKVFNNLGHDYESSGNYTYAEKLFRRASQVQPDDIGAFINLGRMLKQLAQYEEAEQVSSHSYSQ